MQTQTQVSWACLGAVHGTGSVFGAFGACGAVTDGWCKEEAAAQLRTSTIPWAALHRKTAQRAPWDSHAELQHVWHGVSKSREKVLCGVLERDEDKKITE